MITLLSVKTSPISSVILLLEKLQDCKFCWISPQLTFCVFGIMPFNVLVPLVGTSQFLFRFFLWRFGLFHLCLHFCLCVLLLFLCHLPSLSSFYLILSFMLSLLLCSYSLSVYIFCVFFLLLIFSYFFSTKNYSSHHYIKWEIIDWKILLIPQKIFPPQKDNAFSKKPQSMQDESFHKWKP